MLIMYNYMTEQIKQAYSKLYFYQVFKFWLHEAPSRINITYQSRNIFTETKEKLHYIKRSPV